MPQRANIVHYCHPDDDMTALCEHPSPAMLIEHDGERVRVKALDINSICEACRTGVDHGGTAW